MSEAVTVVRMAAAPLLIPRAIIDGKLSAVAIGVYVYATHYEEVSAEDVARHFGLRDSEVESAFDEIRQWQTSQAQEQEHSEPEKSPIYQPVNPSRAGFIYVIKAGPYHKIGLSSRMKDRVKMLAIQLPHPPEVVFTAQVEDMWEHEERLHKMFAAKRMNGEWFDLCAADIDAIRQLYAA